MCLVTERHKENRILRFGRKTSHGTPISTAPRLGLSLGLGFHGMPWRSVEGSEVCRARCRGRFCRRWSHGMSRKRTTMYMPSKYARKQTRLCLRASLPGCGSDGTTFLAQGITITIWMIYCCRSQYALVILRSGLLSTHGPRNCCRVSFFLSVEVHCL